MIFLVSEVNLEGSLVWLKDQVLRPKVVSDDEALVRYPLGIPSMVNSLAPDRLLVVEKEMMLKEMLAPMMKE